MGSLVRGDDKPLEGDLKKIQGKWTTTAGPASTPIYFTFDKNMLGITVEEHPDRPGDQGQHRQRHRDRGG